MWYADPGRRSKAQVCSRLNAGFESGHFSLVFVVYYVGIRLCDELISQ
jgi:hypothetical protein